MADIILPPALIDTTAQESQIPVFNNEAFDGGPFLIGGNLYEVMQSTTPTNAVKVEVWKTTITGVVAASVNMDLANAPVLDFTTGQCRFKAHVQGDKIHIAYQDNVKSQTVKFAMFNTTLGIFQASPFPNILDSGFPHPPAATPQGAVGDFGIRSDGSAIWVSTKWNAGLTTQQMVYQTCPAAGAWSVHTVLESAGAGFPPGQPGFGAPSVGIDATDTMHTAYLRTTAFNAFGIRYAQVTLAGVLSGPSDMIPAVASPVQYSPQVIKFLGNSIIVPIINFNNNVPNVTATVMVGTPLAAPVWTRTDLEVIPGFTLTEISVLIDGATATAVWIHNPDANTIQLWRSQNSGAGWGPNSVFWDMATNPPNAQPIANQFMSGLSVGKIGSMGAIILCADASGLGSVSYLLFQAGAAPVAPVVNPLVPFIFPFPCGPNCSTECTHDVAWVKPRDGRIEVISKGPLGRIK